MALDVNKLTQDLLTVFQNGKNAESSDEVAAALAQAIHAYVSQAEVDGIEVDVVDNGNNPLGSGTQKSKVTIL
jgi:hypothetical protein